MDFKKCSRCGNFYLSNTNVCPKCSTKENFEFSTFKSYIEENGFSSIKILQNNSFEVNGVSVCGSRGWFFDSEEAHDEKVLNREVGRIKMSLDSAECEEKILFLHYPPITTDLMCEPVMQLIKEYGIKRCYYGHLHGAAARLAIDDEVDGCGIELISCDRLAFVPKLIIK